jgi:hypothetical protein
MIEQATLQTTASGERGSNFCRHALQAFARGLPVAGFGRVCLNAVRFIAVLRSIVIRNPTAWQKHLL